MGYLTKGLAIAALIGAVFMLQGQQKTATETSQQQSESQRMLLARETAASGLRMAASNAWRDFDEWRTGYDRVTLDGGSFDVNLQGTAAGPIQVVATGSFGGAQHQVQATLARLAPARAALVIDADTVEAEFPGNDFVISGRDTRPGSAARVRRVEGKGHGGHVNGVWMRGLGARSAFQAAASGDLAQRIRGQAGESDVAQGSGEDMEGFPVHLGQLFLDALVHSDETHAGGVFNNRSFGSAGDPQIIVINGPAAFLGTTRGYGLLVVQGSIAMHDDFEWEGVILVRQEEGDMEVSLTGNASIYGALVARHGSTSGSDEEDGAHSSGGDEDCGDDYGMGDGDDDDGDDDSDGDDDDAGDGDDDSDGDDDDDGGSTGDCVEGGDSDDDDDGGDGDDDDSDGDDDDDGGSAGDCVESNESGESGEDGEGGAVGGSGSLQFTMRDNAAIYYSTEAIGKLAARLPLVKDASWIVKFDQIGEDLRARHDGAVGDGEQ